MPAPDQLFNCQRITLTSLRVFGWRGAGVGRGHPSFSSSTCFYPGLQADTKPAGHSQQGSACFGGDLSSQSRADHSVAFSIWILSGCWALTQELKQPVRWSGSETCLRRKGLCSSGHHLSERTPQQDLSFCSLTHGGDRQELLTWGRFWYQALCLSVFCQPTLNPLMGHLRNEDVECFGREVRGGQFMRFTIVCL